MPVLMTATSSPSLTIPSFYRPAVNQSYLAAATSGCSTLMASPGVSSARPAERMRLRPWLIQNIEDRLIPGLEWIDYKEKMVKIPWKHAARHGWTCDRDASLFKAWAIHTKKYDPISNTPKANPKTWKANFRCAINSLPDIQEVKGQGKSKGNDAFKIYKLIPKTVKKNRQMAADGSNSSFKKTKKVSRVGKPSEAKQRMRCSVSSQHYPLNGAAGGPTGVTQQQHVADSALQLRLQNFASGRSEAVCTGASQPQRTTDTWNTGVIYCNRRGPASLEHYLPSYPGPSIPSADASVSSPPPVRSPPPPAYHYPHHHRPRDAPSAFSSQHGSGAAPLLYVTGGMSLANDRGHELLYAVDVTRPDEYPEITEAESDSSSVYSDKEVVQLVHELTQNSPVNSPTRSSSFDGEYNSGSSSSYWHTADSLDSKPYVPEDGNLLTSSSVANDLSLRPPPPDYMAYAASATSHAYKLEARASCQYMSPALYDQLTGHKIEETTSGTRYFVM